MFRIAIVIVLVTLTCGCSTVDSLSNNERGVKIDGTYCEEIQHVMSGTNQNICKMYGEPKDQDGAHTRNNLAWIWVDTVFSFGADILVLPYTVYKQVTSPSIKVNPERRM